MLPALNVLKYFYLIYLIYCSGYLKNEKNEEAAESFLKSSPHLTECYQMSKANRKFNVKVDGFNLQGILEIFGTMCRMSKFSVGT